VSIDGREVREFGDILLAVQLAGESPLTFRVVRDGKERAIVVTPRLTDRMDPLGNPSRDPVVGIGQVIPGEIGDVVANSPASTAGVKTGDILYKANGQPVESF